MQKIQLDSEYKNTTQWDIELSKKWLQMREIFVNYNNLPIMAIKKCQKNIIGFRIKKIQHNPIINYEISDY